jgi:hypothetical protein
MRTKRVPNTYVAFSSGRLLARGPILDVAKAAKEATDAGAPRAVQVFHDVTAHPVDLDLGGSLDDVLIRVRHRDDLADDDSVAPDQAVATARAERPVRHGPGRPRLGVVAREVTLLPRHWEWLADQPGGASAALRRLVDEARATYAVRDELRRARDAVYRFLLATLGDAYGFEEAMRALWANDEDKFIAESAPWPPDLRTQALRLARAAFHPQER